MALIIGASKVLKGTRFVIRPLSGIPSSLGAETLIASGGSSPNSGIDMSNGGEAVYTGKGSLILRQNIPQSDFCHCLLMGDNASTL